MENKTKDWLKDTEITDKMRECARNFVNKTNEFLGSNFTTNDSIWDILEALSEKWHECIEDDADKT